MNERLGKLAEIFQEAAEAERQARLRYEEAALLCDDPILRDVLTAMAQDEARHEQEVIARFRQIAQQMGGVH